MILAKDITHIHIIGIAGTAMGSFAGLLKSAGFHVSGSDEAIYSPMKEQLARWQIPVSTPYSASNLIPAPDLVVVGNVVKATNVEAVATQEQKLPFCSFPQALSEIFLKEAISIVATGTHGKTTCSSLLAHTLEQADRSPNFLIGGIPKNFGMSSRRSATGSQLFVLEGDEYDTAYFDKTPKFLHYRPKHVLCTSIEFDHADIFSSVEEITEWFKQLFALVPSNGSITANLDSPEVARALKEARIACKVLGYGHAADYQARRTREDMDGIHFDVYQTNVLLGSISLTLSGQHNIDNALGSYALLTQLGLSHAEIASGFASFLGAARRLDVVGAVRGVTVIDDFAHHPTAVKTTLDGLRQKYPHQKIWAIFEPRSATSCRDYFQQQYATAFVAADRVFIAPCGRAITDGLNTSQLAKDISRTGITASATTSIDQIVQLVGAEAQENTVILCMSNGAFGGIHQKLLDSLSLAAQR